ncbi:hypothetical protein DNTS_011863 [Danionella cerebrum]|uniref:Nudix hydrolase domain-containing protein n=1 Tax=Danionella cerebrum TaxID=2873325 RepID=A0A553Q7A6_9TELE|nr:hypothetical protein DNTS_011863 [Danionella translucida]
MDLKERVTASLRKHASSPEFSRSPELSRLTAGILKASVLVPLLIQDGELRVLLTVRSLNLRQHAGEVCFPGGKEDASDRDEVQTALREAEEEIGLKEQQVEVVCQLFPIINKEGLLITPVVGFLDASFCPHLNPQEVCEVFSVPLEFFTREEHHSLLLVPGALGPIHSFIYRGSLSDARGWQIWGLTAAIAITVASLGLERELEFDPGFETTAPAPRLREALLKRLSRL